MRVRAATRGRARVVVRRCATCGFANRQRAPRTVVTALGKRQWKGEEGGDRKRIRIADFSNRAVSSVATGRSGRVSDAPDIGLAASFLFEPV